MGGGTSSKGIKAAISQLVFWNICITDKKQLQLNLQRWTSQITTHIAFGIEYHHLGQVYLIWNPIKSLSGEGPYLFKRIPNPKKQRPLLKLIENGYQILNTGVKSWDSVKDRFEKDKMGSREVNKKLSEQSTPEIMRD